MLFGPPAHIPLDFQFLRFATVPPFEVQQRPMLRLGDVTIEADRVEVDVDERRHSFFGRVLLRYFETTMEAESGVVDLSSGKVTLSGNIVIRDPWGTLRAEGVEADIEEIPSDEGPGSFLFKGGVAKGVEIDALEGRFRAESLTIEPRPTGGPDAMTFRLTHVMATACDRETPDFQFRFRELIVRPGDIARWKGGELWLGRGFRLPFPDYFVTLAERETGIALPQPTFSSGFRAGYRWRNLISLGPDAQFLFEQSAAFDSVPAVNTHLAYSLESRSKREERRPIAIRNEDGERFRNGYWDNVTVRQRAHEDASISQGATAMYVGRSTNAGATQRLGDGMRFDRDWFVGAQSSGEIGPFPWQVQLECGAVRPRLTSERFNRAEGFATLAIPDVRITDSLAFRARADIGAFLGNSPGYGWLRPMFGFVYAPSDSFALSAGYFKAQTFGSPQLDIDRLYSSHALHVRADLHFPATDLSVLVKYDFDRKQLYDIEVGLSQLMHCVRPYIAYRKDPGAVTFGFELEAQRLFEALSKRNPRQK